MPLQFDMPMEKLKSYQGRNPKPDDFDHGPHGYSLPAFHPVCGLQQDPIEKIAGYLPRFRTRDAAGPLGQGVRVHEPAVKLAVDETPNSEDLRSRSARTTDLS